MTQVTIGGGRVVCEMDVAAVEEYKQVVGWLQQALASRDDAYAALKVALAERDTARETHRGLVAERDAAVESKRMFAQGEMKAIYERNTARVEANVLSNRIAGLRATAQAALDKGGDRELIGAPIYQQALEDIASEEQDD